MKIDASAFLVILVGDFKLNTTVRKCKRRNVTAGMIQDLEFCRCVDGRELTLDSSDYTVRHGTSGRVVGLVHNHPGQCVVIELDGDVGILGGFRPPIEGPCIDRRDGILTIITKMSITLTESMNTFDSQ